MLAPEGWFVDCESFGAEHPAIEARLEDEQLRFVRAQLRKVDGRNVTLAELAQKGKEATEKAGVCRSTLQTELRQLRQAGFHADCIWRLWRIAVIAAYKGTPQRATSRPRARR